jgi:hypothetical protein
MTVTYLSPPQAHRTTSTFSSCHATVTLEEANLTSKTVAQLNVQLDLPGVTRGLDLLKLPHRRSSAPCCLAPPQEEESNDKNIDEDADDEPSKHAGWYISLPLINTHA